MMPTMGDDHNGSGAHSVQRHTHEGGAPGGEPPTPASRLDIAVMGANLMDLSVLADATVVLSGLQAQCQTAPEWPFSMAIM